MRSEGHTLQMFSLAVGRWGTGLLDARVMHAGEDSPDWTAPVGLPSWVRKGHVKNVTGEMELLVRQLNINTNQSNGGPNSKFSFH